MEEKNLERLRELVDFLKANGIAEFDIDRPDLKMRIKFAGAAAPSGVDLALAQQMFAPRAAGHASAGAAVPATASSVSAAAEEAAPEEKLHEVKSPIVGTFYDSPSPGSPAFVKVGDQVEVGDILCIVEAMKLMNEIESDVAGEVVKRIAATGQPVEYGQPLFAIRPK
ncbi:MAG TPA: acetyl-CoA carboxylase biotin carboxyl carrier protein [Acidobacteriaceae bacterium]|nr:acetyl-CoA carboxylase biotin carboxyl carrier protein [Acidobacteriaceae bacterium]